MQRILEGVRQFRTEEYPRQRAMFEQLARKQQKPKALFITCADSRVHPNLITMTEPGDLFLLRNAGTIIPPNGQIGGGEAATIEYSVEVLGIQHIIICGHSQCGAMQALLANRALDELPAARAFFAHAESTRRIVQQKYRDKNLSPADLLMAATEENVLVQLSNLSTHPCVAARLAAREVSLYGWYYDIASGTVLQFDQGRGQFIELDGEPQATTALPIRATTA